MSLAVSIGGQATTRRAAVSTSLHRTSSLRSCRACWNRRASLRLAVPQSGCWYSSAYQLHPRACIAGVDKDLSLEQLRIMLGQGSTALLQDGVSISASDETSIDVGVLSFQNYVPATQQALTQYNVHSVSPTQCDDNTS